MFDKGIFQNLSPTINNNINNVNNRFYTDLDWIKPF